MSKILFYTDVHWSETSSIINTIGKNYTVRLEHLIQSVSWAEEQADKNNCDIIICLGDFFDKPTLTSQELTALNEVKWSNKPHYFLVGNHESPHKSLTYNSVNALCNLGFEVINKPTNIEFGSVMLDFIPYTLEEDRKPLKDYLTKFDKPNIVLSHNEVKGLQYGSFLSKDGFNIEEIDNDCDLFLNGHLHNGIKFSKKGYNLGNLTGQNFTEDAEKYSHNAFILDTDSLSLTAIENPYAFNFYKILIEKDIDIIKLAKVKPNAIISVKCNEKVLGSVKEFLESSNKILAHHSIIYREDDDSTEITINTLQADNYLQQFSEFVILPEQLGRDPVVLEELAEIMK